MKKLNLYRSLFYRAKIKIRSLADEWIFEHFGIPTVKGEKISKSILKAYLPRNPIVIDCGAHDGSDSILLYKVLGGSIHAFEPVPEIYNRLLKNCSKLSIRCYPVALSNVCGESKLFKSSGTSDASSSLLAPKNHLVDHPTVLFTDSITVGTVTLDQWAHINKISEVHLLWLDMQGAELQMLQASEVILPTVKVIHTEISIRETYEEVGTYEHLRAFLLLKGFSVVVEAIPNGADMGNVVFARI